MTAVNPSNMRGAAIVSTGDLAAWRSKERIVPAEAQEVPMTMDLETANRKFQKELNAGAGALMVLGLLVRTGRPMYGYEIGKHLQELAEDSLPMHHGALYPTLRSLERGGLLATKAAAPTSGPLRRYYQVTALGHKALGDWLAAWARTKKFVDAIVEPEGGRHASRKASGGREVPERPKGRVRSATRGGRRGSAR